MAIQRLLRKPISKLAKVSLGIFLLLKNVTWLLKFGSSSEAFTRRASLIMLIKVSVPLGISIFVVRISLLIKSLP